MHSEAACTMITVGKFHLNHTLLKKLLRYLQILILNQKGTFQSQTGIEFTFLYIFYYLLQYLLCNKFYKNPTLPLIHANY